MTGRWRWWVRGWRTLWACRWWWLDIIKRSNWRVKSEKRVGKNLEPEKRQGRMRTQPGTEYIARMGTTVLVASVHHLYPPLLAIVSTSPLRPGSGTSFGWALSWLTFGVSNPGIFSGYWAGVSTSDKFVLVSTRDILALDSTWDKLVQDNIQDMILLFNFLWIFMLHFVIILMFFKL